MNDAMKASLLSLGVSKDAFIAFRSREVTR